MPKNPGASASAHRNFRLNLAVWRERRGVNLEQIAESTKISLRFLRAIEAEEFETLPGGVFDVSYIRQYAAAVEYDVEQLLACYREKSGAAPLPGAAPRRKPAESERNLASRWLRASSFLRLF